MVKFVDKSQDRMESMQDIAVLVVCVNFTNISCICLLSEEVMTIFCTKMARFGTGASLIPGSQGNPGKATSELGNLENLEISIKDNDDLEFYIRVKENTFRKIDVQEIQKYA
jgi:hypothetical protein